jgi:hypothetical protein
VSDTDGKGGDPPQLHIWDDTAREFEFGTLTDGVESWSLVLITEQAAPDLCRGRISFRRGEDRYDTDAILLEESEQEVAKRASELPASTLRQFLSALRS